MSTPPTADRIEVVSADRALPGLERATSRARLASIGQAIGLLSLFVMSVVLALAAQRLTRGFVPHAVALAIVACIRPSWGLGLFLAALPIFGNKPATPQVWTLLFLGHALSAGLAVRGLVELSFERVWRDVSAVEPREVRQAAERVGARSATCVLLALYGVASVMTLSSVALVEMWHDLRASTESAADPIAYVVALLRTQENDRAYCLYTVLMTLHALAIAAFVRREARSTADAGRVFARSILIGLTLSLVIGLMDFYLLVDLRSLRALDPIVNPRGVQDRLQSTFGHSGWFAEYVTMAVPYCMVLLLSPMRYAIRIALILLLLLIGELTLILTYQRGGWLSYPFALFAIWLSIYHMAAHDKDRATIGQTLRRSFVKIAISLPATVLISLALVYVCAQAGWLGSSRDLGLSRYADRAAQLSRASDRMPYIAAGFQLGTLHPVLGAGSESFSFSYFDEFVRPGGAFYDKGRHPLGGMYGSAHNVYAQTFSGKGAVGLVLLIALIGVVLIGGPRVLLTESTLPAERRLLLLMTIAATFAFAAYGLVQEVFYIQSLQYLVFATFGLYSAVVEPRLRTGPRLQRALWLGLACAFALHLAVEYGYPGRTRERNFWQQASRLGWTLGMSEVDRQGARFWWTGERAVFEVPREARLLSLPLRTAAPSPQTVRIIMNGAMVDEVRLTDHAWRHLRYPLPKPSRFTRKYRIELFVEPTWQPAGDGRRLGVMVGSYSWTSGQRPS